MNDFKYKLSLTDNQLSVLLVALEDYFRTRMNQWFDFATEVAKNGYEYEAEQEFCELLDTILSNPEWCHTARVQSKEIADTFDKSSFAEKIENIYESVTL